MKTEHSGHLRLKNQPSGFTLIEILIVVIILGLIAAIALPKFSNAAALARANTLRDNIRTVRVQLAVFKGHHLSVSPGYPNGDPNAVPTAQAFLDQLTLASKENCSTAPRGTVGYDFGPYFYELPANPVNGKAGIEMLPNGATFPTEGDNSHGYVYQPSSMQFRADTAGTDEDGEAYFNY